MEDQSGAEAARLEWYVFPAMQGIHPQESDCHCLFVAHADCCIFWNLDPECWQLHNLSLDPAEIHDRSKDRKDILDELLKHWRQYVKEVGVVLLDPAQTRDDTFEDEMADARIWMRVEKKYETSSSIALREKERRAARQRNKP